MSDNRRSPVAAGFMGTFGVLDALIAIPLMVVFVLWLIGHPVVILVGLAVVVLAYGLKVYFPRDTTQPDEADER